MEYLQRKPDYGFIPINSNRRSGRVKAVKILACCILVFPLAGTGSGPRSKSRTIVPISPAGLESRRAPIRAFQVEGAGLFRAARYSEAQQTFETMRSRAEAAQFG